MGEKKVVLITGGAQGIGLAIAERFASEGWDVAVGDMKEISNQHPLPDGARYYKLNVAESASVNDVVAKVAADFGRIDALVNNAGIARDRLIFKMAEEDFDAVIGVNLKGPWLMAKAAAPHLKAAGGGAIVNITSCNRDGMIGQTNYSASKAGLVGLTYALALDLARQGTRVNAVAPGYVKTDMTAVIPEEPAAKVKAQIPLGRDFGSPAAIADAVFFVATNTFMTRSTISVDGGYRAVA